MTTSPTPDDEPDAAAEGSEKPGASGGASDDDARPEAKRPIPVRAPRPVREEGRPTVPKPVRAGLSGSPGSGGAGDPEVPEVELELPDETLAVRVRGRSRGHTSEGSANLLLLGFHRPDEDGPVREALVVGSSLEALSPLQLEAAWEKSREPRDPFRPSQLFPGTSRNRGRGRGR